MSWKLLSSCVLLLASLAGQAYGHGYLNRPMARSVAAWRNNEYYCPQCGQGGGPGNQPGICGDPFQDSPPQNFGSLYYGPKATYTEGQVITTEVILTANHGGRFSFSVCPLPKEQVTQACFNQPQNRLRRVDNQLPYFYPQLGAGNVTMQWMLPAGVSCPNGCMFQWWYVGYQNCIIPCDPAGDVANECGKSTVSPAVGPCSNGYLSTEQFINCADIIINPSSGGSTPLPTPSPSPASGPTPTPTPSPTPTPTPGGCVDTYAACAGWGPSSCVYGGVPAQCPCMCGGGSTPTPSPSPATPTGCVDTYAACAGWGPSSCIYGGVPAQCPCMCAAGKK